VASSSGNTIFLCKCVFGSSLKTDIGSEKSPILHNVEGKNKFAKRVLKRE